ncbi:MAG: hypothetical protein PHX30_03700 [Candidatus Pacebacteria bacterium]|nr:hypothetical protein [Candidatus Paceibacterota bacterium]
MKTFFGHDGAERALLYLDGTPLFVLKSLLDQSGSILERGSFVKVLRFGSEVVDIKISEDE